jgi:glycosyltransferase involved in cell wall biosynthesis
MPKVLRIINRFNLGGPTYNVAYLTRYISDDYETLLVGGAKDESEDSSDHILEWMGLKPVILPDMKREIDYKNDLKAYRQIKKIIKEFKPDIVHTHAAKAGTLGRLAAYELNVPVIVHTFHGHVFHSYFGKMKTGFYKIIERYLAKKSDCIIAISERQKYELSAIHKICSPDKIKVIPLGFDLSRFNENLDSNRKKFREEYGIKDDEIIITIIGRLVPVKNHALFLRAIKFVKQNTTEKIRAFIVGDGEERENIENMCLDLELSFSNQKKSLSDLTFTSWIKNVEFVCAGSDIIALTSFNEGTPVSLIEAQASNRPVVSTKVGGIENIIIEGKTGLLSDSGDEKSYMNNLLMLVNDPKKRLKLGAGGWENVKSKYHYSRLVKDMENLYKELLSRSVR